MIIKCYGCGNDIALKYLKEGDVAECKNCGVKNQVPPPGETKGLNPQDNKPDDSISVDQLQEIQDTTLPKLHYLFLVPLVFWYYLFVG